MIRIDSPQNQRVKNLSRLQLKSAERKKQKLFVVEGLREIERALQSGFILNACWSLAEKLPFDHQDAEHIVMSKSVFEKLAYRENSDGLLAVFKTKSQELTALKPTQNPFYIVLESVEKPGNLGAVLRSCDASGADGLIICDPKCDIYNPNAIRSSVGCLFSVPVVATDNSTFKQWCEEHGIKTLATTPHTNHSFYNEDLTGGIAILMGTEATGLTDFWLDNAQVKVKLPMLGIADSLNVSVSAAVCMYETRRHRMLAK